MPEDNRPKCSIEGCDKKALTVVKGVWLCEDCYNKLASEGKL